MDKLNKSEYTRGSLARKVGCHLETIRFYEKEELMPEPLRADNGYRLYGSSDVKRLNFILRCKELGFSISEVRELLSLVDQNDYTCSDIRTITTSHIKAVKTKIVDLKNILKTLQNMAETCETEDSLECPILDALFKS